MEGKQDWLCLQFRHGGQKRVIMDIKLCYVRRFGRGKYSVIHMTYCVELNSEAHPSAHNCASE